MDYPFINRGRKPLHDAVLGGSLRFICHNIPFRHETIQVHKKRAGGNMPTGP